MERLDNGVYYLESIDHKYRRKYKRKGGNEFVVHFQSNTSHRLNAVKNHLCQINEKKV